MSDTLHKHIRASSVFASTLLRKYESRVLVPPMMRNRFRRADRLFDRYQITSLQRLLQRYWTLTADVRFVAQCLFAVSKFKRAVPAAVREILSANGVVASPATNTLRACTGSGCKVIGSACSGREADGDATLNSICASFN